MRRLLLVILGAGLAASACGTPTNASAARSDMLAAAKGDILLSLETTVVSSRVRAGATLASLLRGHDVAIADAADIVSQAASVFDLRKVRANQPYRLETTHRGTVRGFEYEIDGDRVLRVGRAPDQALTARVLPIPKTRSVEVVTGGIDRDHTSLVSAIDAAGESIELTLAVADIFGGDIDFSTELQPGDRFELAVEKQFRDDHQFAGYGPVLAAEFTNAGRRVRAMRFTPDGGAPGYYDEHGRSMKRFFLASPLKFQPIVTSGFSSARMHPVLREIRAHLGVDYRAPAGSPVVAVADGVVVSAAMSAGAGRMVHLRHANGFETEYLHLSVISVRAGARVRQGELIGRVGSSGLATGPHLDYRLKKNGAFINPVTAHRAMPPADPIPAVQMAAFEAARDRAIAVFSKPAAAGVANPPAPTR
ncbi:MAG TPA: M23 family metallopeptidase [Vicinamibacterales bacterium]|nr:M23 family metallopeptidase [Vicinamibacterales bacterium]